MTNIHWYSLNWFDWTIIGVILLSMIVSFFRGFLREAVSLITWIAAVLVGLKFATPLSEEFVAHIESATLRYLLAFLCIFFVILIIGFLVNVIIKYLVDKTGIGIIDRLVGVVFGAARGILAVGVILMFLQVSPAGDSAWWKNSNMVVRFRPLVSWLNSFLPEKVKHVSLWMNDVKSE